MSTPPQHAPLCLPVRFPAFRGRSTPASADPLGLRTLARGLFRWKCAAESDPWLIRHKTPTTRSDLDLVASDRFFVTAKPRSARWSGGCLTSVPPSALTRTTLLPHLDDQEFGTPACTFQLKNRLVTANAILTPPPRMSSGFFKKFQVTENKWFMHTDSHCFAGLDSPFATQWASQMHFPNRRTQRVRMPSHPRAAPVQAPSLVSCLRNPLTVTFERFEDLVGRLRPNERLRILVVNG